MAVARPVTAGEKTAAQAISPAVATSAATAVGLHVGVAMESFSYMANGQVVSTQTNTRIICETAQKTALQASDRAIVWET